MKKLTAPSIVAALAASTGVAQARDLGPDETLKLRDIQGVQWGPEQDASTAQVVQVNRND